MTTGAPAKSGAPSASKKDDNKLRELLSTLTVFHTPKNEPFARVPVRKHFENYAIGSPDFKSWISRAYWRATGQTPTVENLTNALEWLKGKAIHEGDEFDVHVRIGSTTDAFGNVRIYLDLANEDRKCVEIDAKGWKIVNDPPIRFRRPPGMLGLPSPVRGGTIDALRPFLNTKDEDGWTLTVAWILGTMAPNGPYPLLELHGQQGSSKSTATRVLQALVDPSVADLRAAPRNEHELFIGAHNNWIVGLDNLSGVKPWLSDALCRVATGAAFTPRRLYTDSDETILQVCRPVIINGIGHQAVRGDLLDRAISVELSVIPPELRKDERAFWADFEEKRPEIIGALLDAVVHGLRYRGSVRLERKPRMADFALWTAACEGAFGWEPGRISNAYHRHRAGLGRRVLEADPVACVLLSFMKGRPSWQGTMSDLLTQAAPDYGPLSRAFPTEPNHLSRCISGLAEALNDAGLGVRRSSNASGERLITLAWGDAKLE